MFGEGFLGQGAPRGADLNLLLQIGVGLMLVAGMALARRGRYGIHGICQSCGFAIALTMTVLWMIPALHLIHADALNRLVVNRITIAVAIHVVLGTAALLVGAWVILVAGTPLVPERLRFSDYKRWMRTLLTLWWLAIVLGLAIYRFGTS
jgi:uncharacterized membrane protein YozB (DUF420 family)